MKKYRVVIVENDEDEQFFMKEAFDASNLFDIIAQLQNGDELFDWLAKNQSSLPDIILSDLNMPGKNGYDIIKEVTSNAAYAQVPVLITSTSSTKTIMDKCIALGAADYLVKPDTFMEYKAYVKNLYELIEERQLVK